MFQWMEKADAFKNYITNQALYPHFFINDEDNQAFHHKYIRHTVTKTIFFVMDVLGKTVSWTILLPLQLLAPVYGALAQKLVSTAFHTVGAVVARIMFRSISLSVKVCKALLIILATAGGGSSGAAVWWLVILWIFRGNFVLKLSKKILFMMISAVHI